MTQRKYQVRFAHPQVGRSGAEFTGVLSTLCSSHGEHLPAVDLGGERYQVRDLQKVGRVWKGTFGKLRDDAPHRVTSENEELELAMDEGDRLLEKCHFLYREIGNLIVWQINRASGGMSRFEAYMSQVHGDPVLVPPITNQKEIDDVLSRSIYEISYSFDRPPVLDNQSPSWNQEQFNTMKQIDAGFGKFDFRAARGGKLSSFVRDMLREALSQPGVQKIRVRLTDETDPIELFAAPLKDKIVVEQHGRYPRAADVFSELEKAYDRNLTALSTNSTQSP